MNVKSLIKNIALPLVIGIIVGLIMMPFNDYKDLVQPPFSPPAILFPIVWTILYILMGISAYIISLRGGSLSIYFVQLFVNALWSILVIKMIKDFLKINSLAGYLQIPYLIWLIFAAYLNLGVYILN